MSLRETEYVYIVYLAKRKGYLSSPAVCNITVVLNLYQGPFGCKWFAFGLVFQYLSELFFT
jgi:hypothetical protein